MVTQSKLNDSTVSSSVKPISTTSRPDNTKSSFSTKLQITNKQQKHRQRRLKILQPVQQNNQLILQHPSIKKAP